MTDNTEAGVKLATLLASPRAIDRCFARQVSEEGIDWWLQVEDDAAKGIVRAKAYAAASTATLWPTPVPRRRWSLVVDWFAKPISNGTARSITATILLLFAAAICFFGFYALTKIV